MTKEIKYISVEVTPQEKEILNKAKDLVATRGLATFLRDSAIARAKTIIKNHEETWPPEKEE